MKENLYSNIDEAIKRNLDGTERVLYLRYNYQRLVREGYPNALWGKENEIVVGGYTSTYRRFRPLKTTSAAYKTSTRFVYWSGIVCGAQQLPYPPTFPDYLDKEAYQLALPDYRSRTDPQIVFAEYLEVIHQMKSIIMGFIGPLIDFIKTLFFARSVKDLSSAWVQYNFMFRPLLADIEVLLQRLSPKYAISRCHREAKTDQHVTLSYVQDIGESSGSPLWIYWDGKTEFSCRCTIIGKTRSTPFDTTSLLDLIKEAFHFLTLGNPYELAKSAWNLVPFSWAIDYFINIGGWIDYYQPNDMLPEGTVVFSRRTKVSARATSAWSTTWVTSWNRGTYQPGTSSFEQTTLARIISNTTAEAYLIDRPQLFGISAGLRQASYLIAILLGKKSN